MKRMETDRQGTQVNFNREDFSSYDRPELFTNFLWRIYREYVNGKDI